MFTSVANFELLMVMWCNAKYFIYTVFGKLFLTAAEFIDVFIFITIIIIFSFAPTVNLESPICLTPCMTLDCGRREYLERIHSDTGRACKLSTFYFSISWIRYILIYLESNKTPPLFFRLSCREASFPHKRSGFSKYMPIYILLVKDVYRDIYSWWFHFQTINATYHNRNVSELNMDIILGYRQHWKVNIPVIILWGLLKVCLKCICRAGAFW